MSEPPTRLAVVQGGGGGPVEVGCICCSFLVLGRISSSNIHSPCNTGFVDQLVYRKWEAFDFSCIISMAYKVSDWPAAEYLHEKL
jgi:hypothetical protein